MEAPRTLLEQLIRASDHTLEEWCASFDEAARRSSEDAASLSVRSLQRWMAGEVGSARKPSRRVAARLWGYPFHVLTGAPSLEADVAVAVTPADNHLQPASPAGRWDLAASAIAHESMDHAAQAGGQVDDMTLDQVVGEARRIARSYTSLPPLMVLKESRRARDLTYLLLEQTKRPAQTTELYFVAGQLCGLMAGASFDLAAWDASIEQSRAAYVYADLIGHSGLRAWARGHQALIAYWINDPLRAVALAEAGLAEAPPGSATARLYGIAARAWSHVGDHTRTRQAIGAADRAREDAHPLEPLHDEIGGEFGWGRSRHEACAGSALVQIGDGHGATARIRRALELLPDDPHGGLLAERAYCDLATAELARQDLDAAASALNEVWDLPALCRSEGVTGRLQLAVRLLTGKQWRHDGRAGRLREQILMFNAEASARALPAARS